MVSFILGDPLGAKDSRGDIIKGIKRRFSRNVGAISAVCTIVAVTAIAAIVAAVEKWNQVIEIQSLGPHEHSQERERTQEEKHTTRFDPVMFPGRVVRTSCGAIVNVERLAFFHTLEILVGKNFLGNFHDLIQ